MQMYRAIFQDDEFEIIHAESDSDAIDEAFDMEDKNNIVLFNVEKIDEDYNTIEVIY